MDPFLESGELVVGWLNRGTLHLVHRDDYWWLHSLTTARQLAGVERLMARRGIAAATERGVAAIEKACAAGPASRAALRSAVRAARCPVEGQALVHVVFLAALRGLVVRGPVLGGEQGYVLAHEWLGPPVPVAREEVLARLGERYLAGHAPGDDRDLAYWAGVPLRDARAALATARPPGRRPGVPAPRLLGAFDPVLCGWASRAWVLGSHAGNVVSGGLYRPFALVDGRAVATWSLRRGQVALAPFVRGFDASVLDGEVRAVEAFAQGEHQAGRNPIENVTPPR